MSVPGVSLKAEHQGASPIDGKTPVHFLVGVVAGMSGLSASWATVVVIGFEAFLITLEEGRLSAPFEKRSPQSYGNQAVDTMAGIAGVYYGEVLKKRQGQSLAQAAMAKNTQPKAINTQLPVPTVKPVTEVSGVSGYW